MSRAVAIAWATRAGSRMGVRSTNHTPSWNPPTTDSAVIRASRVLPAPGGPTIVSSRTSGRARSSITRTRSRSLAMSGADARGSLAREAFPHPPFVTRTSFGIRFLGLRSDNDRPILVAHQGSVRPSHTWPYVRPNTFGLAVSWTRHEAHVRSSSHGRLVRKVLNQRHADQYEKRPGQLRHCDRQDFRDALLGLVKDGQALVPSI